MQTFFASSQQKSAQCPGWYPDTGAKNRVTSDLGNLNIHGEGHDHVRVGNGQGLTLLHFSVLRLCSRELSYLNALIVIDYN